MSKYFPSLLVGLYTWISAVFFGAILLDLSNARNIEKVLTSNESITVLTEISDTLLYLGFFMVIAALAAIAASWKSGSARNLFIASLLTFSFEFLVPLFFSLLKTTPDLSWVRLLTNGTASMLAFIGLYCYIRDCSSMSQFAG